MSIAEWRYELPTLREASYIPNPSPLGRSDQRYFSRFAPLEQLIIEGSLVLVAHQVIYSVS